MGDVCPQACPSNTHTHYTLQSKDRHSSKHHFKGRHYARKMSLAISQFHASVPLTCLWKTAGHGRKVKTSNSENTPVTEMEESEFCAADGPLPSTGTVYYSAWYHQLPEIFVNLMTFIILKPIKKKTNTASVLLECGTIALNQA